MRALIAALLLCGTAQADIITEFGGGLKLDRGTSVVFRPECRQVLTMEGYLTSCGGDNPVFVGWPIAWEREYNDGVGSLRIGWFHLSHWFDGGNVIHSGDIHELKLNCLCASWTVNWSQRQRTRSSK